MLDILGCRKKYRDWNEEKKTRPKQKWEKITSGVRLIHIVVQDNCTRILCYELYDKVNWRKKRICTMKKKKKHTSNSNSTQPNTLTYQEPNEHKHTHAHGTVLKVLQAFCFIIFGLDVFPNNYVNTYDIS